MNPQTASASPSTVANAPSAPLLDALVTFTAAWGPSGREGAVRDAIIAWLAAHAPTVDIVRIDALGNLFTRVGAAGEAAAGAAAGVPADDRTAPGRPARILIAAHMDEIGVIATHVDATGFVRCSAVGGVPIADLVGCRVRFESGLEGVIDAEAIARKAAAGQTATLDMLYIDVGAPDRAACPVRVGDAAAYAGGLVWQDGGRRAMAHNMDNRAGCAALAEALRRAAAAPGAAEVWGVFTVQEEIGLRGARTAGFDVPCDVAIAVDITGAGDLPGAAPLALALGGGAAVKISDGGMISHRGVVGWLERLAADGHIPVQPEVLPGGTTDAAALQLTGAGVPAGAVSIPTRHAHRPGQVIDLGDLEAAAALLAATRIGPSGEAWYTPQD